MTGIRRLRGIHGLLAAGVLFAIGGCGGGAPAGGDIGGAAPMRGFGVAVDQAVSARVPVVHLRTCGTWGCHDQDVPLLISGGTSAGPCPTGSGPDVACAAHQLPGPGPGYGYAPVPDLTLEPVTVTVTTPPGAALSINVDVRVQPRPICPDSGRSGSGTTCAGATPQAKIRIAADGTVSQA